MAQEKGAQIVSDRVVEISFGENGKPLIKAKQGQSQAYDLLAVAAGVNSPVLKLFAEMGSKRAQQ